jgi:tetratricopeptide (TPR) repeat protein
VRGNNLTKKYSSHHPCEPYPSSRRHAGIAALLALTAFLEALMMFPGCTRKIDDVHRPVPGHEPGYDSTITATLVAIQRDSTNAELHFRLGKVIVDKIGSRFYRYLFLSQRTPWDDPSLSEDSLGLAIRHLELAVDSVAEKGTAYYYLGRAHYLKGAFVWSVDGDTLSTSTALRYLNNSLSLGCDSSRLLPMISDCYRDMGKPEMGIRAITEAIRKYPARGSLYLRLGNIQLSLGLHEAAYSSYRRAMAAGFDNPGDCLQLARFYSERAQDVSMVGSFHKSIQFIPTFAKGFFDVGFRLFRKDRLALGIELCEKAVALDPSYVQAITYLAKLKFEKNQPEQAARLFIQVLEHDTLDMASFVQSRGPLYIAADAGLLRKVVEVRPDDDRCLWMLAQTLDYDQAEEAIKIYNRLTVKYPESGDIHYKIGMAKVRLRDTTNAIAEFNEAMKLPIANPDCYWRMSAELEEARAIEPAVEAQRRYLTVAPVGYWNLLGLPHFKRAAISARIVNEAVADFAIGRDCSWKIENSSDTFWYHKAIGLLSNAIRLYPEFSQAYERLGFVYRASGDSLQSMRFYKRAAAMGDQAARDFLSDKEGHHWTN